MYVSVLTEVLDALMFLVPIGTGLMFLAVPTIAGEIFAEPKQLDDALTPIALDLWRLLGCMLFFFGMMNYIVKGLPHEHRVKFDMVYLGAGSVLAITNTVIQLQGHWTAMRWWAPAMEWIFVIYHAYGILYSDKIRVD